jgi:outer membrane protein W
MFSAVPVQTAPQRGIFLMSLFAAVLLSFCAHPAAATEWVPMKEESLVARTTPPSLLIHLHGGMFTPTEVNAPSPTIGMRLSKLVSSNLQAGVLTGYTLQRKDQTADVNSLPGTQPKRVLARSDAQLVPLMGFLRVNFTQKFWLVPYFGVGAGYEWLSYKATDYQTDVTNSSTFSNWAWEGWVGMGLRLGQSLRVNGEIFYNGASLEREVVDENAQTWKEVVDLNGVGARVGLDLIIH